MADKAIIGEQPAQIGMPVKQDAEQVKGLALEPVGRIPDRRDRGDARGVIRQETAQAQAQIMLDGKQMIDHGEARRGGLFSVRLKPLFSALATAAEAGRGGCPGGPVHLAVGRIINAAQIAKLGEGQGCLITQAAAERQQRRRGDDQRDLAPINAAITQHITEILF